MITECRRCHQMAQIREGEEPTLVCDHCAQEIVATLVEEDETFLDDFLGGFKQ
jgi:hypothetical protein